MDPLKQQLIAGKYIVGIDPAKKKHQAVILTPDGLQLGKSFCFDVSYEGYTNTLWKKVANLLPRCHPENTLFAIETSCNLWMTLAFYLKREGYTVVMVSPLTTHLSRPMAHHDFSRTDPKDALLVASNAHHGNFDLYQEYSPSTNAMHRLGITYDKLRKELAQNRPPSITISAHCGLSSDWLCAGNLCPLIRSMRSNKCGLNLLHPGSSLGKKSGYSLPLPVNSRQPSSLYFNFTFSPACAVKKLLLYNGRK